MFGEREFHFPSMKKVSKVALGALAMMAIANVPTASAGIFSGIATLVGCVGLGVAFPANLVFAAAPCYELTLLATANPLIP